MEEKNELIDSYNNLTTSEKRKELGREIAELTLVTQKLINDINKNYKLESMEEFENLFDGNLTEDQYLVGLYEDVIALKETVGTYYNIIMDLFYEEIPEDQIN